MNGLQEETRLLCKRTMASRRIPLALSRLPRRLCRPPTLRSGHPLNPRWFTSNPSLHISPQKSRPALPFLHHTNSPNQPTYVYVLSRYRSSFTSLLSPERKQWLKSEGKTFVRYSLYIVAFAGLGLVTYFGVQVETLDRAYPAPREWGAFRRLWYSWACNLANEKTNGRGIVDWARVGSQMKDVLRYLEDPGKEGKDTQATLQDDGQIYVEGVGKAGLDISQKSEPWRRGYYDVLLHLARAAENLDGWVRDTTRNIAFPPEVVIGPSNPHPKNVPFGAAHAPLEENCVPAWDPPEFFYMKLLTTQGFSTRQRLDAAIAWADWLDFKGLKESSEATYDWVLDIAMGALPVGANNAVDIKTGIISKDATYVSENLLHACTALGTHHARNGDLASGLPILLSVLRARRRFSQQTRDGKTAHANTPIKVPFILSASSTSTTPEDSSVEAAWSWLDSLKTLIMAPPYPPPAPDYNLPPVANSPETLCAEAALTAHVGEVLFAGTSHSTVPRSSSGTPATRGEMQSLSNDQIAQILSTQTQALAWTKEAVDLAERALIETQNFGLRARRKLYNPADADNRRRCQECLEMAMQNWEMMLEEIRREQEALAASSGSFAKGTSKQSSKKWFSFWGGSTASAASDIDVLGDIDRWEKEREMLEERKPGVRRLLESAEEADRVQGVAKWILGEMR